VEVVRGEDVKLPNDMYGFTFKASWTPAASNPEHTDKLMDSAEDGSPWAADSEEAPF
jgi:hypothetical protein